MREILFRGKRTDNGTWTYGYLFCIWERTYLCWGTTNNVPNMKEVFPETVCQYTGLTDKNGRKIFEGDVIEFADFFDSEIHRGVAYWCDFAFWLDCTETEGDDEGIYSLAYISSNALEVIGNIYDNPELLEVKQND